MQLYQAMFSPNALRVRAVVYELGIDLEMIEVDVRNGGNRTPEYLRLNPNGKVPVLVDGELVIWESRAINAYLAAKYPDRGLYPAELSMRARIDQWSYWQAIHLGPSMQKVTFERVQKPLFGHDDPDEAAIAGELKNVDQFLDVFETGLGGKDWIAGQLSLADFALATTFMHRVRAGISLDTRPQVAAWIGRMEERPSWRKPTAELPPLPKPAAS